MNPCSFRASIALFAGWLALLCLLPVAAYAAPSEEGSVAERLEARFAEERKARDQVRAAIEPEVLGKLRQYQYPIQESQCAKFVVDWNQVTTVQAFIDASSVYSKQLGNCLHQETDTNVQDFVRYLLKQDLGTVSWYEDRLPDSIRLIPSMLSFHTNYERCSHRCFERATVIVKDAVSLSRKTQADFLSRWDLYYESAIKPAVQRGNPQAGEEPTVEEQWRALRELFEMYAFTRHQADA